MLSLAPIKLAISCFVLSSTIRILLLTHEDQTSSAGDIGDAFAIQIYFMIGKRKSAKKENLIKISESKH